MPDPTVPPFPGNIAFNAQHSPMGAFFSFTCGHFGTPGGLGSQIGRPANQDLYIGVKEGDRKSGAPLKCLPFYENPIYDTAPPKTKQAGRGFVSGGSAAPTQEGALLAYRADQLERHYGWATDRWVTPDFEFAIYTPFGSIVDPEQYHPSMSRVCLLPAVLASLTIDNTGGSSTKTGVFAINFNEPGARLLPEQHGWRGKKRVGFALRRHLGVQGMLESERPGEEQPQVFAIMRNTPQEALRDVNPAHGLGQCPGIAFEVAAGKRQTLIVSIGVYHDGIVTTGLEGRYLYARYFSDLNDVLDAALRGWDAFHNGSIDLDNELLNSGLSADQQFLIAHATRSYYGSTQLLEVAGQPFWVVNEGEYCMMNTLDLSVDQCFWELKHNPWVVRNLLDNYLRYYSYYDQVKRPGQGAKKKGFSMPGSPAPSSDFELMPGGISFCHDMGAHNNFAPTGHSSYELPHHKGWFSYMTQEQLCNWILLAASYVAKSNDQQWARRNEFIFQACLTSMVRRSGSSADNSSGAMKFDSSRCQSGEEITTYDSLDASLGPARGNLYLAVKCWAAYLGLAMLFDVLGPAEAGGVAESARKAANNIAACIAGKVGEQGFIPATLIGEAGAARRILPAIEALAYPMYWRNVRQNERSPLEDTPSLQLLAALKRHTQTLLADAESRNRFSDGGLKLSSTSDNSWVSKIALFQHVARGLFNMQEDARIGDVFRQADAAHVKWQTQGESAYWAMSDQMVNGVAKESKYYPRAITTALWMK